MSPTRWPRASSRSATRRSAVSRSPTSRTRCSGPADQVVRGPGLRRYPARVTDRETRRLSFGSVATDYDRYRPGPPPQALDWLIPPDAEAEVLAGRGEDIPLPAASVDAVVISSAWHWLDPERAVPEIARVLRVGGVLGVIWISRDSRVPWVAEFNALARDRKEADRRPDDAPRSRRRRRTVEFPPGAPMSEPEELTLEYSLPMTSEQLAGLLGTYSGVITLEQDQRAQFSRRVQAFLDRQPWDQVDLPMICRCLKSTRLPG